MFFFQSPNIEREKDSSSTVVIAGDKVEDQPATTTADEDLIKKLVRERPLVLVTAGKAGAGKSTLINNLLGLKGKKAAESKASPKSVTKAVDYYEEEVHGFTVRVIDTPGLEAEDLSSQELQEALEDLSALTDGKADIMLYCMKLTDRADKKDECIVKKLTKAFGKEMWRHTVLVLTFGDAVLNQDEGDRDTLESFTNEFEEVLKKAGVDDVPVKSILSAQDTGSELESVQQPEVIGVPVGRRAESPQDWVDSLFKEIIKKCKMDSIPAMLMLQGMTPGWVAAVLGLGGLAGVAVGWAGGGMAGGIAGTSIGGVVGGAVGGAIGAVFGGVGAVPGAAVGATIGEGIGAVTGAVTVGGAGILATGSTVAGAAKLSEKWFSYAAIVRARQRVEELKKKKENEKEEMKAIEEKKGNEEEVATSEKANEKEKKAIEEKKEMKAIEEKATEADSGKDK